MAETDDEKKAREAKEAEAKATAIANEAKAEEARLAQEAKDTEAKKRGTSHDPHHASADVTRDFFDKEWSPFKKANPGLFAVAAPPANTVPAPARPHHETCVFGVACPFPNESH